MNYDFFILICKNYIKKIILNYDNFLDKSLGISLPLPHECNALKETKRDFALGLFTFIHFK